MPSENDNGNIELTALRFIANKTRTLQGWLVEGEDLNMLRELAELETRAKDALASAEQRGGATSALLNALENLVRNQEEGWRATGTMPEEHIQAFPYLREARAAIKQAREAGISGTLANGAPVKGAASVEAEKGGVLMEDATWHCRDIIRAAAKDGLERGEFESMEDAIAAVSERVLNDLAMKPPQPLIAKSVRELIGELSGVDGDAQDQAQALHDAHVERVFDADLPSSAAGKPKSA